MKLVPLRLQTTLEGFGMQPIKGVAGWRDQICVATDRFIVLFEERDNPDDSNELRVDIALPPEISHVVTIAAGRSYSDNLFILSDWIWTLSRKHKLTRWIEAPNVSSISVSYYGDVLLAENPPSGIASLKMFDKNGAVLRTFVIPLENECMKICQAELTSARSFIVSVCGRGTKKVLFVRNGIVKHTYDSSTHESLMHDTHNTPMHDQCEIPNKFIAKGCRIFVAETYSDGSMSSCHACREKIVTLGKDYQLRQIILPDLRPNFKHFSRICCSGNQLIVVCMKVNPNEVLTPVVNVYEVDSDTSDTETEDESESESDDESETEDKNETDSEREIEPESKSSKDPDNL